VPDTQILAAGSAPAPEAYTVPSAQEILVKAVACTFNGGGASGDFLPMLSIVPPGGVGAIECPMTTTVTAGASAEVSWFPGGLVASANLPLYVDFEPVVQLVGYGPLADAVLEGCAVRIQPEINGLVTGYAGVLMGFDTGTGAGPYNIQTVTNDWEDAGYTVEAYLGGVGQTFLASIGHPLPAFLNGHGDLYAYDGTSLLPTSPTFPGTYAVDDVLFEGSWFGRLVPE
jgi:hypothetical protein